MHRGGGKEEAEEEEKMTMTCLLFTDDNDVLTLFCYVLCIISMKGNTRK